MDCTEEFTEFASGYAAQLRRTAYLLCGNWHTAELVAGLGDADEHRHE